MYSVVLQNIYTVLKSWVFVMKFRTIWPYFVCIYCCTVVCALVSSLVCILPAPECETVLRSTANWVGGGGWLIICEVFPSNFSRTARTLNFENCMQLARSCEVDARQFIYLFVLIK